MLNKKSNSPPSYSILTLAEILDLIRINADVPGDFEEYCEIHFVDPSDEISRGYYLDDLRRAERFKKFITQEEIRSFPFINEKVEKIRTIDLDDEYELKILGYSFIFLNDKKEHEKLAELDSNLEYHANIVKSYGFDIYTGDFNAKKFPITKEESQRENIAKDFKYYIKTLSENNDNLKELIKRYNIKATGNLVQ